MSGSKGFSEMKARAIAVGLSVGLVTAMGVLTLSRESAQARPATIAAAASPEAVRIFGLASKDEVSARKQMLALYRKGGLHSGSDYVLAAQTLETTKSRQDLLMAHDMALAALALGQGEAKPIIARTEDRLFKSLGLGERYGTLDGGNLPLTREHRQLMTMADNPNLAVRFPETSVN
jgi:hypothetical protein